MSSKPDRELLLTADEYAELDEGDWPTELVRGRVVREPHPAYGHGQLQVALAERLRRHLREHAPELVCTGPFGVITETGPDTVRGPDLAVLRRDRLSSLRRSGFLDGAPELAIEIVSPSNRAAEIQAKVAEYLEAGAELVWVVYPTRRTVVVHEPDGPPSVLREGDALTGGGLIPELSVPVGELFED